MDVEFSNKVGISNIWVYEVFFVCCFIDFDYLIIKVLFI